MESLYDGTRQSSDFKNTVISETATLYRLRVSFFSDSWASLVLPLSLATSGTGLSGDSSSAAGVCFELLADVRTLGAGDNRRFDQRDEIPKLRVRVVDVSKMECYNQTARAHSNFL